MPTFSWLDHSERDRRKMLEVVDLFKERETRDELGLGSVRDSFADQLFPGTSTIMTRARYFLLVAWTYRALEDKKTSSSTIAGRARKMETALIEAIGKSDDNAGNIGKYAKDLLKRLPSSVYWQGLAVWGIRAFPGSMAQYHRSLDRHHKQKIHHGRRGEERDAEHDDLVVMNWHGGLVKQPEDFPETCSLRLSREEARYLRDRIHQAPRSAGTVLAQLAGKAVARDVEFIWQHPGRAGFSQPNRILIDNAHNFSEVMHGASLLYNLILAEQLDHAQLIGKYRDKLAAWSQTVDLRMTALESWNRPRFWELVDAGNSVIHPLAQEFINTWWDLVMEHGPRKTITLPAARTLITRREKQLKKNLARIGHPRLRDLWKGDAGSAQLDYRWFNSKRLLDDISEGLEVTGA